MYYAFEHSRWNWNVEVLVFEERGKPLKAEKEPTTNLAHIIMVRAQNQTRATSVGGKCSHHCTSPALIDWFIAFNRGECKPNFDLDCLAFGIRGPVHNDTVKF